MDINDLGYDNNLNKLPLTERLSLPYLSDVPTLIPETPASPATGSPVTTTVQSERVLGGDVSTVLFSGKDTFTDFTNPGWRQGIDPVDNQFKWIIGSSVSQIDYNISHSGALTFTISNNPSTSNAIFIDDASPSAWPAVDIRRSVGTGSGIFIGMTDPAGYGLDIESSSNTAGIHVVMTGSGALVIPLQLQKNSATSTNYWEIAEYRGGSGPSVSVSQWVGTTSPNGVLDGSYGDILQSSAGKLYINTDNSTGWEELATTSSVGYSKTTVATVFETSGRFGGATGGGGTVVFNSNAEGVQVQEAGGAAEFAKLTWSIGRFTTTSIYKGNPTFTFTGAVSDLNATNGATGYVGLGAITTAATGHTFTEKHIGFKFVIEGGVLNIYASNADGTTQKTTSILASVADDDQLEFVVSVTSDSSITFKARKNGGTQASVTHTENIPASSTAENLMQISTSVTSSTGSVLSINGAGFSYHR